MKTINPIVCAAAIAVAWGLRETPKGRCWGGAFGLIGGCLVAEEARRLLSGCVRTLLGRYFVPGWETRCPCLGNGSYLLGNFLYLLGNLGLAPRNFGFPSWSGVELPR